MALLQTPKEGPLRISKYTHVTYLCSECNAYDGGKRVVAGRVGFDHKYPWAFPSLKSKGSHANGSEINNYKSIAEDAAVADGEIKRKTHRWL